MFYIRSTQQSNWLKKLILLKILSLSIAFTEILNLLFSYFTARAFSNFREKYRYAIAD